MKFMYRIYSHAKHTKNDFEQVIHSLVIIVYYSDNFKLFNQIRKNIKHIKQFLTIPVH